MAKEPAKLELNPRAIACVMHQLLEHLISDDLLFFEDEVGHRQIYSVKFGQAENGKIDSFVFSEDGEGD